MSDRFIKFAEYQTKNSSNRMKELTIYTSERLGISARTKRVAEAISAALNDLQVKHGVLKNTKDYWCRDYMPVMISDDGKYAQFTYEPDYLKENEKWRDYITNQQDACNGNDELNLFMPFDMDIVFDGGNYVRCGDKVIMTDKIFSENPDKKVTQLLQDLEKTLSAEIVLLPWDMKDSCGHADGMVAYLGDGRVLLNGCWNNPKRKQSLAFHRRLRKILNGHFNEVIELPFWDADEDSWCYLNYLKVPGGVLLPCLSENCDSTDDIAAMDSAAKVFFEKLFSNEKVISIYAKPLVKGINGGGALHCVTWEYIKKTAQP